ncbi:hypothetical protein DFA_11576 [Cavenderia fasciculata]|uniref:Uncharacterized protein n=1 Tax=Cavenderia fasciculata TaxID=261658 RepID=F4QDL8_CACFS|nr:uncharacterized protein DFA_11576 [Cavenderia fasciculata]EGG13815.1 hypothetical protein DFA_11576 [Cavenderia fasciculata]|eukprot:XP_004350523.1 hypothetical protein DFA_11576 [Cavenderia fasciculata]
MEQPQTEQSQQPQQEVHQESVKPSEEPSQSQQPQEVAPDTSSSSNGNVANGTAEVVPESEEPSKSASDAEKSPRESSDTPVSPTEDKSNKKKVDQKGGFFQLFRKKEADPISIQREKGETDSLVNLIKAYQPTHPDVKSEGSILPSQFESIFKDLAVIYQMCGDHQKTLKRHIKEIVAKSAERAQIFKLWNHLINEIQEVRPMIIDSTFIEVSLKSVISDPFTGQEQEEFEQLLKNCLYQHIDVPNVIDMIIAFSGSKYKADHNIVSNFIEVISSLKDKSSTVAIKADIVIQQLEKSRHFAEELRANSEKFDVDLNTDYKKQSDIHNTNSSERMNLITGLEQEVAKNTTEILNIDGKVTTLQQQLDELLKQKTAIESTNAQSKKKLDDLKKDEKKDQVLKQELDELKVKAENMTVLHESITKLKQEQDHITKSYVSTVLDQLNQSLEKHAENRKKIESSLEKQDDQQEDKIQLKDNLVKNKEHIEQISKVVEKIKNKLKEEDYDVELVKSMLEKSRSLTHSPVQPHVPASQVAPAQAPASAPAPVQPATAEQETTSTTSTASTTDQPHVVPQSN